MTEKTVVQDQVQTLERAHKHICDARLNIEMAQFELVEPIAAVNECVRTIKAAREELIARRRDLRRTYGT